MEVLIAVALSSVIMMALFGMFNAVVDVSSHVKSQEGEAYGERIFESILFDDLRSINTGEGSDFSFSGKSGSFLGNDGELMAFCTSTSLNSSSDTPLLSLQRVEYQLKSKGDTKMLYRRERPYAGISGNWKWIEVPVLAGVSDIEVEYLDPLDNSFVTDWSGKSGFPGAVRITVTYPGEQDRSFLVGLSFMAAGKIAP